MAGPPDALTRHTADMFGMSAALAFGRGLGLGGKRGTGPAGVGGAQTRRDHLLGAEPGVHRQEAGEAPEQQSGPNSQHHTQRDLYRHQDRSHSPMPDAEARARPTVAQGRADVGTGQAQGGYQAEHHSGQQREHAGEQQHAAIHRDVGDTRRVRRQESHQESDAPERQRQARRSASPSGTRTTSPASSSISRAALMLELSASLR